MKSQSKATFASSMKLFGNYHDLKVVFDDFLQMAIAACAPNPQTGKSFYEDEYMQIISKYEKGTETMLFKHMFAQLVSEMTERLDSHQGFDVLGEFFETFLVDKSNRKSQFFTPWPVCQFMAKSAIESSKDVRDQGKRKLRILDPTCGSGRMLLAASRVAGPNEHYFGIDIDTTCTWMTTLNMFLNGIFHGECMCANALNPSDFKFSYRTRLLPFGIKRVEDKQHSLLWNLTQTAPIPDYVKQSNDSSNDPRRDITGSRFGDQLRLL